MPIYEYHCQTCGASVERLQKLSDPLLVDCPACGNPSLIKQVSAAAFTLKGDGWYATDYKKKPTPPEQKTEASSTSTSADQKTTKNSEKSEKPAE